jgi:CRP-like cAMP-binding protein
MRLSGEEKTRWLKLLLSVEFFSGLTTEDLTSLLDAGELLRVGFHEFILREGDEEFSFFVLLKGSVKLLKLNSVRKQKELATLYAGNCFGEISVLIKEPRTASVLAAEECYLFKINEDQLETIPDATKAKLYKRFSIQLAHRLRETTLSLVRPDS